MPELEGGDCCVLAVRRGPKPQTGIYYSIYYFFLIAGVGQGERRRSPPPRLGGGACGALVLLPARCGVHACGRPTCVRACDGARVRRRDGGGTPAEGGDTKRGAEEGEGRSSEGFSLPFSSRRRFPARGAGKTGAEQSCHYVPGLSQGCLAQKGLGTGAERRARWLAPPSRAPPHHPRRALLGTAGTSPRGSGCPWLLAAIRRGGGCWGCGEMLLCSALGAQPRYPLTPLQRLGGSPQHPPTPPVPGVYRAGGSTGDPETRSSFVIYELFVLH